MSTDDDQEADAGDADLEDTDGDVRERLEREADKAIEQFDESLVDLLSWVLDTETRARIYVHLRQHAHSTSDEVAEGTGLYPSTVREALADMHDEAKVRRQKRESGGAGNNPYEYSAMPPSNLVSETVEEIQDELNTVFNLDRYLGSAESEDTDEEPVTITVEDAGEADRDASADGEETASDGEDGAEDSSAAADDAADSDDGDGDAED